MNEFLRDRILRKLDGLSDERLYQVLDYVEFLQSKYAERQAPASANAFQKFAEAVVPAQSAATTPRPTTPPPGPPGPTTGGAPGPGSSPSTPSSSGDPTP